MIPTKPLNPAQLQTEALAVTGGTHVALTLMGGTVSDGIVTGATALLCSDVAGSSETHEPCPACVTAYNAHVAVPTAIADPLKPFRDALSTAAASDPGLDSGTKTALTNLLAAMAPRA